MTNFGRFGPYVKHNDEFRSLESDDDVFNISFERRWRCLRAPKQSRRRQATQKKTLKELTHNGTTIKLLAGRYGPYVTDGTTNASVPKSMNPGIGDVRAGGGTARGAPQRRARATPRAPPVAGVAPPHRPPVRGKPPAKLQERKMAQGCGPQTSGMLLEP